MVSVYQVNDLGRADVPAARTELAWTACRCAAEHLTPREAGILRQVAEGLSNREIAVRQLISRHTVDRHLVTMLRRSGARNRAELVSMAYLSGILLLGGSGPALSGRRCLVVHLPASRLDQER
jgi:DNA-binding CsgD family transcriptional regulator